MFAATTVCSQVSFNIAALNMTIYLCLKLSPEFVTKFYCFHFTTKIFIKIWWCWRHTFIYFCIFFQFNNVLPSHQMWTSNCEKLEISTQTFTLLKILTNWPEMLWALILKQKHKYFRQAKNSYIFEKSFFCCFLAKTT